jgi:hypothetical protein
LVSDGPRPDRPGENARVAAVRRLISEIDWPCEVSTNFAATNLGCRRRVATGIDWVFQLCEQAIILEDDCLPDPSFFPFCEELLDAYKNDKRVGIISGSNHQLGKPRTQDSYYFSRYLQMWGWATWRDRWQESFDVDMRKWPTLRNTGWLHDLHGSRRKADQWRTIFDNTHAGKIDTWDYQWLFANWVENRLAATASVNLVCNLGDGPEATHTIKASRAMYLPTKTMSFPLRHPQQIERNYAADEFSGELCYYPGRWKYLRKQLKRALREALWPHRARAVPPDATPTST